MPNNNSFFQWQESRANSGYKSAWLVQGSNGKYSLIAATETVPYPYGDSDTFDYDLLQAPTKGQVEGKMSLDAVDVEVLHHRDNAYRFEKLKGQTLNFMSINAEYVGYKFVGTVTYRPNSAEADINRATVTITPMSAETTPVYDARGLIEETLCFESAIPATAKTGTAVDFSVKQTGVTPTITVKSIAAGTNAETDATSQVTTSGNKVTFTAEGLYAVTVSAEGYAPWTTTVYAEA